MIGKGEDMAAMTLRAICRNRLGEEWGVLVIPTSEKVLVDGREARVWQGVTTEGMDIRLYALAIVPYDPSAFDALSSEVPDVLARDGPKTITVSTKSRVNVIKSRVNV